MVLLSLNLNHLAKNDILKNRFIEIKFTYHTAICLKCTTQCLLVDSEFCIHPTIRTCFYFRRNPTHLNFNLFMFPLPSITNQFPVSGNTYPGIPILGISFKWYHIICGPL